MTHPFDEEDDDFAPSSYTERERRCAECERETAGEQCGFCRNELCPMCFECGAGFCSGPHTQEQIDAYADLVYGPPTPEQLRQRVARDELKRAGINL